MSKPKSEKWYAAMAAKRGKTARNQYTKAKELGLPKPEITEESRKKRSDANKNRPPMTEETKKKISESRIKFLHENPHMVPYKLNHYSKGRSYAEEYWKAVLDSNNLVYDEQYQIGPYQLDFAFVDAKIDLEIDGDQHHLDPRVVKSDIRRNEYLESLGWEIIRVKWSDYQKLDDKKTFVDGIMNHLSGSMVK
jgi:very-short-patch-repair endonuclease